MSSKNGRMEIKISWPILFNGWIGTRTVNFICRNIISWCSDWFFENLFLLVNWSVGSVQQWNSHHGEEEEVLPTHHRWGMVQWGWSQRVGLESVQFSKPTGIEKIKFQWCKPSHIWVPNARTRLKWKWTVSIKEEDRWGETTMSRFGRESCQARIESYSISQNYR